MAVRYEMIGVRFPQGRVGMTPGELHDRSGKPERAQNKASVTI